MEFQHFLSENGSSHLAAVFEENGIDTVELLEEFLRDDSFEKLIVKLGDRLKLKRKISSIFRGVQSSCQNNSNASLQHSFSFDEPIEKIIILNNESETFSSTCVTPTSSRDDYSSQENYQVNEEFRRSEKNTNVGQDQGHISSELCKKKHIIVGGIEFSLDQLLDSTLMGKALKQIYASKNSLPSCNQSYLVEIIVQHFINTVPFKLNNEDFRKLAKHIVDIFPREIPQVYFTSPIKKRFAKDEKSGIARGKLVDKYRNRLTFLRSAGILPCRQFTEENDLQDTNTDADEESQILLKYNAEPWSEVVLKWNSCYEHRRCIISKKRISIEEILEEFPIIKNPLGYSSI
ncbi:uncharacterized protein LOC123683886 isoform X2 [Harmonia axyridis]|uniref:uncharacterized protein LOC123683886 isoform X2 n=1 Tax=Harmonia axyridis TaxID=115357 RepID=UPI001E275F75|nr:uncharacterized protein LOC123683886 isoform X2 [Harmonia axyridis]